MQQITRNVLMPVKKRLRFSEEDDLNLLREVAGQNPFEHTSVWTSIKENVFILSQKDFSIKSLKDHLDILIKAWLGKIKILKDRSGIEETFSEKDQLCQNIHDYMIQFRKNPEKTKNASLQEKRVGKAARDKWANNFSYDIVETPSPNYIHDALQDHLYYDVILGNEEILEIENTPTETPTNLNQPKCNAAVTSQPSNPAEIENKTTSTPVSSKILRPVNTRKRKINIQRQGINYLQKYDEDQKSIKQIEYKLEERRIALEERKCALEEASHILEDKRFVLQEKKFEFEKEKEKIKLNLEQEKQMSEIEERKNVNDNIKNQNQLLGVLINKLSF